MYRLLGDCGRLRSHREAALVRARTRPKPARDAAETVTRSKPVGEILSAELAAEALARSAAGEPAKALAP